MSHGKLTKRLHWNFCFYFIWIAPKSMHSQQRFFTWGIKVRFVLIKRNWGFNVATDDNGFASCNPYSWSIPKWWFFQWAERLRIQKFWNFHWCCTKGNAGKCKPEYFDGKFTITSTLGATAILEAGRRSLDSNGQPYDILYENEDDINAEPVALKAVVFS